MNIKHMILLEMCKSFGVPYAYPLPLSYTEDELEQDEDCEENYKTMSINDIPDDHVSDGAEYLMNYQIFENEKQQRTKLRAKIRKSNNG